MWISHKRMARTDGEMPGVPGQFPVQHSTRSDCGSGDSPRKTLSAGTPAREQRKNPERNSSARVGPPTTLGNYPELEQKERINT